MNVSYQDVFTVELGIRKTPKMPANIDPVGEERPDLIN